MTRKPSPLSEPTNSPMTAPITASVIATFSPEKTRASARGEPDLGVDLELRCGELPCEIERLWCGASKAGRGIDDNRKKRDEKGNDDLRKIAITEPDQKNRRERDLRDRLRH